MKTLMNVKTLTAGLLASLLMVGSALAMDSAQIESIMQDIGEKSAETTNDQERIDALEAQVKELEELIHMMMEEDKAS